MTSFLQRIEQKYCVPEYVAARALRVAELFLGRDQNLTAPQRITSLYFDSATLTFFSWHQARRWSRFKLRLRAYGAEPPEVIYAEVKHKMGRWVHKRRAPISSDSAHFLFAPPSASRMVALQDAFAGSDDLLDFHHRLRTFGAAPKMLIRCEREAFRGAREEAAVAVTVDRDIRFQRTWSSRVDAQTGLWNRVPVPRFKESGSAILEIKSGENSPVWIRRLSQTLTPYRVSFSKYATATLETLRLEGRHGTLPSLTTPERERKLVSPLERISLKGALL